MTQEPPGDRESRDGRARYEMYSRDPAWGRSARGCGEGCGWSVLALSLALGAVLALALA